MATGYVVAPSVDGDAAVATMELADAAVEGDLLPDAEDDAAEGPREGEDDL